MDWSIAKLQASLAKARRQHTYRQRKLDVAHKNNDKQAIDKWSKLRRESADLIRRRESQIKEKSGKPRLITARSLGLTFQYVFGSKGTVYRGAGHYTAGHRAATATELKQEMLNDHRFHKGKGWGGLSYEAMVADDGTIGLGNPMNRKSAAVASNNSGMINICVPGTTGDNISAKARESIKWLLDNWHTSAIPSAHRLPRPARTLRWKGHKEWPQQSTACPGDMLDDYRRLW